MRQEPIVTIHDDVRKFLNEALEYFGFNATIVSEPHEPLHIKLLIHRPATCKDCEKEIGSFIEGIKNSPFVANLNKQIEFLNDENNKLRAEVHSYKEKIDFYRSMK